MCIRDSWWIGWDKEQQQAHLHRVIGMSRFLIRPSVDCHNLASKVLSMSLARLAVDFEQRYKYRPYLVESFVDIEHYSGTCYRAANWIEIDKQKGVAGRIDGSNRHLVARPFMSIRWQASSGNAWGYRLMQDQAHWRLPMGWMQSNGRNMSLACLLYTSDA